jgi:hypothetical protein
VINNELELETLEHRQWQDVEWADIPTRLYPPRASAKGAAKSKIGHLYLLSPAWARSEASPNRDAMTSDGVYSAML